MMRICLRAAVLTALIAIVQATAVADDDTPHPKGEAIPLFNGKDLSGWTVFVDPRTERYSPESSAEGIFTVEDGMIHATGERFACLTTEKEFDNYHLQVEFKWGEKKWPPRVDAKRDAGILMHVTGPEKVWPKSIECQIQEGDCGDIYIVGGTALTVDGERKTSGRVVKKSDAEKPNGEWNTVEVICDGGTIVHIVNGVEVNRGTDASVTRGRITLQSEGAEIFYRNVELRPLNSE